MKILITGSNGLLGQKISDLLINDSNITFLATGFGPNRNQNLPDENYNALDITDFEASRNIIEQFQPTVIINAAAMTNVDACETQQTECLNLNVYAVENLAKISAEKNIHLIHISTDFIFDGTKKMYDENDAPNPLSFYGNSKWLGEKKVAEFAKSWCIVRTVLVYGVVSDGGRSNIVLWAKNALEKGQEINVVNDQWRTPTLSEDLAWACVNLAKNKLDGIWHIAGKDFMNIFELVSRVGKFFNLDLSKMKETTSDTIAQPAKRPPITGLSIEKAKKYLSYNPHSFEEGLELVRNQLKN